MKYPCFAFSSSVRDQGVTWTRSSRLSYTLIFFSAAVTTNFGNSGWHPAPSPLASVSTIFNSFVASRLDYCSAIYEGLTTCRLKCLDRVLRTAALLVGLIPRFGRCRNSHRL